MQKFIDLLGSLNANKIIIGQKVNPDKSELARKFRKEMTPEESILWRYLRNSALGFKFRRQQVIDGFIVDFYCHALGLVIEVDGGIHQTQKDYDLARDRIIQTRGLQVLRVSNEDIHRNLYNAISQIKRTCLNLAESRKRKLGKNFGLDHPSP